MNMMLHSILYKRGKLHRSVMTTRIGLAMVSLIKGAEKCSFTRYRATAVHDVQRLHMHLTAMLDQAGDFAGA